MSADKPLKPSCAYLGPAGSNSETAARRFVGENYSRQAHSSLADIFALVSSGSVDCGIVPLENVIQGPVTETLDLLVAHAGAVWIESSHLLPIRNALGVPATGSGNLAEISSVHSHAQPLFQCRSYLDTHLKKAQRVAVASTSTACEIVAEAARPEMAAIAAPETLVHYGLKILAADCSEHAQNQTRFVVIRAGNRFAAPFSDQRFATTSETIRAELVTSVAVNPKKDRQGILLELLEIISKGHQLNLLSIHSRPDALGGFIFHIDIQGSVSDRPVLACLQSLAHYCEAETSSTAELLVFGSYERQPFTQATLESVAIVGGDGEMGRWFQNFFRTAGLRVCSIEKQDEDWTSAEKADVILLSVPMAEFTPTLQTVAPHLRPGQLLVENCSLKGSRHDAMLSCTDPGVEVLGIHTMFAGDRQNLRGENIVVTPTPRSGVKSTALLDLFYKHGARLSHVAPREHDQRMALLQSLVQLLGLAYAETCTSKDVTLSSLESLSSPNARRMLEIVSRVLSQNDVLTHDLQIINDQAEDVRSRFLEVLFRLIAGLQNKDERVLLDSLTRSRTFHAIDPRGRERK